MLHDLDSTTLRIYNCDSFINDGDKRIWLIWISSAKP